MPIRWTDMDAYNHLNHAVFFCFMTEARADLFKDLINNENMCQFVTAHVECDYKFPYYHPDTIILKQYCESISNSSFKLKYEFFSEKNPDVLYASAGAVMVAFNPATGRPIRIPLEIVALLKAN
jgi:acyl-CoA thioester hydrolase